MVDNQTYQSWFVHDDGTFLNAGQLPATPNGHTTQIALIQPVQTFALVSISVEEKAGSDSLTEPTEVVMVGELVAPNDET